MVAVLLWCNPTLIIQIINISCYSKHSNNEKLVYSLTTFNYTRTNDVSLLETWGHIFFQFSLCDFALLISLYIQFFYCVSLNIQHIEIYIFIYLKVSWGSVVGIAMKLNTGQFDIWILEEVRDFSIQQNFQTSKGPTQPPIQWVQEFFP